jgi:hypothetical protein
MHAIEAVDETGVTKGSMVFPNEAEGSDEA